MSDPPGIYPVMFIPPVRGGTRQILLGMLGARAKMGADKDLKKL